MVGRPFSRSTVSPFFGNVGWRYQFRSAMQILICKVSVPENQIDQAVDVASVIYFERVCEVTERRMRSISCARWFQLASRVT